MSTPPERADRAVVDPTTVSVDAESIRQFLVILRRRWRILSLVWAATVIATAIYTFNLPKQYRPQATLEIRPETSLVSSDPQDPSLSASRDLWENYYQTQETILTSATLHAEAIKCLPEPIKRDYESANDPISAFSGHVHIEKARGSFILKVGFIDTDREKATQIVNTLVSIYLEEANSHLRNLKTGAAAVLSKETLPAMRQKVDDADKTLREFEATNGFIDPQEQYATLSNARRLTLDRITQARLKQIQFRAQLETLRNMGADGGVSQFHPLFQNVRILEILSNEQETLETDLARERRDLRDDHPTILQLRDQIKRVQEKIQQSIRALLHSYELEMSAVEKEEKLAIEEQVRLEKQMADISQRVFQFKRLEGELTTARELYSAYLKKHGEESATSATGLGSVRVIDHARIPNRPFKPDILINMALGGLIGLVIGVVVMFVSEQLDDRIRSAHEIEVFLRLKILAVIPRMEGVVDSPHLLEDSSSVADFETFRSLRAEVKTRLEDIVGPKVIAVLSPMSSEGKSTVASNLAKVLAMDGHKVLIFDADMRRPSMNQFGSTEIPDLGSVLRGEANLEQAIRPSKIKGVDIVGMAKGTSQAAELAGTARFDEVFKKIREGYDYVVVDSAPVNQAAESAVIARRCDAVIMVVRERKTSRGTAQAAKRRLSGMNIKVLGAVLNAVESPETAYGYYGYYYYSYYKART